MKHKILIVMMAVYGSGCATMNDSLTLGGGLGAATGAAATYVGYSAGGKAPAFETVLIGAGIGTAVGLVTSYFTHKKVEEDRSANKSDQFEMYFGDLPPSPFIVPQSAIKKGSR